MTSVGFHLLCSTEWSGAVKAVLIVTLSIVLLEVVALLVWELFFKREKVERGNVAATEPEAEPEPETVTDEESDQAAAVDDPDEPEEVGDEVDESATFEDSDDVNTGTMIVGNKRIKVRYIRSFTATLVQAEDALKGYYSELRNEFMSYGFKPRMSWQNESWYAGRTTYARLAIRGKTLSLYLGLDPEAFADTKYVFRDASKTAKYRETPMRMKITSDRAVKWAKELMAALAARAGLSQGAWQKENYRPDYQDTASLVYMKLIKIKILTDTDLTQEEVTDAAIADIKKQDRTPRDFTTRLMRADHETKARYSAIKNELLRYGMKSRMSMGNESWYIGRTTYAKFAIRGKTLSLYMALDPNEFEGTKYNFRNAGETARYETVPMRVNLKSDRSVKWVKELLSVMAEKKGWERNDSLVEEDFRYVKKKKRKK